MSHPVTPPCPMCKITLATITDKRGEPVLWFTCGKCGYSWCVARPVSPPTQT